jgi:osmoprotectant transport system permease protein
VSIFADALAWLNDPVNWQGETGVLYLTGQHLAISFAAVALACLIAWPLAFWFGHTGRGGGVVVALSNLSRAVPTLALLTLFAVSPISYGPRATVLALAVFAIPPLLANAYTGIRGVDADVRDAARGMGMSGGQVLWRVELPLATPLIAAGLRTASVQVVATATLAALVNGGGLGLIITAGFGLQDYGQTLAGGALVALLALLVEGALALAERWASPRAVRRAATPGPRRTAAAPIPAATPR